jgi:arginine decarboxylase
VGLKPGSGVYKKAGAKPNYNLMTWSIQQSRISYNLPGWSDGYFDINARGRLVVRPGGVEQHIEVDLYRLAEEIRESGLNWPVLVRCGGIIRDRLDRLCAAFADARRLHNYQGGYSAVYPIKVNQQFSVVNEIFTHGGERVGLEAGSKSELMAVLGLASPGGLVICNGYKDREYIRLALIARRLGLRIYLVVEKPSELEEIVLQSRELKIAPLLGLRVRLASIGAGNWQNTGGEKSKFGLNAVQVLQLVERLRSENMLEHLQLLHFHLGSQLANLQDIEKGIAEAARLYADLRSLDVPLHTVDVGGGLGVDYEGTASRSFCSMNYTLTQYAQAIVGGLFRVCETERLSHPEIITESGRAMTAHHALLITNVIDTERAMGLEEVETVSDTAPEVLIRLQRVYRQLGERSVLESHIELDQALEELHSSYSQALLDLSQRARGEQIYYTALRRLLSLLQPSHRDQRELIDVLNLKLADKIFCNLSIFQSLPDVWAIDQVFPIVPLQRLNEKPERRARVEDLTCDSDGRVDLYVEGSGIENSLPVHDIQPGEIYLLGFFMLGAYQEILGDMHNLFGDTDTVNLEINADGSYYLCQPEHGDRVDELLRYVHFEPDRLRAVYRQRVKAAGLSATESRQYLAELEAGLSGYTYHEE